MIKSKSFNFICIMLLAVLIFACLSFSAGSLAKADTQNDPSELALESDTLQGELNVSILSRNDQNIILDSPVDYNDSQVYTVPWKDAKQFTISFTPSQNNPPPLSPDTENPNSYQMHISINYLKGYAFKDGEETDFITSETIPLGVVYTSPTVSDYNEIALHYFSFNIDDTFSTDGNGDGDYFDKEDTSINWGIYQFVVDINGAEQHSLYYFIEPTSVITDVPNIDYTISTTAMESLTNSFEFYLVNDNAYRYIDENLLVWYAYGTTIDGARYALTASDLEDEDFAQYECTASLYSSYYRTGREFVFEVPKVNDEDLIGDWHVWCVYNPGSATALSSNEITVSTEKPFNYFNIIYIVIALCVLAVIVIILIGVYKKKKEKVW